MINSKRKGNAGENEIVHILTDAGFPAIRSNQRKPGGGMGNPDVRVMGLPIHIEVKRTERLNLNAAMLQAERDSKGLIPCVVHRGNRQPWRVTLNLADFLNLCKVDAKEPRGEVKPCE